LHQLIVVALERSSAALMVAGTISGQFMLCWSFTADASSIDRRQSPTAILIWQRYIERQQYFQANS
jgi:hypothetical protein